MDYVVLLSLLWSLMQGEVLSELKLKELDVTNSNLRGNYARYIKDVKGLVMRRTLLPDRIILLSALHRPYVISRGDKVRIILNQGNMTISAAGVALSDASVGDAISVKNIDTGVIVSGSALDAGTVRIIIKMIFRVALFVFSCIILNSLV